MLGPSAVHHLWGLTQTRYVNCRHNFSAKFFQNFSNSDVVHRFAAFQGGFHKGVSLRSGLLPNVWYGSGRLFISALSIVLNSTFSVHIGMLTRCYLCDWFHRSVDLPIIPDALFSRMCLDLRTVSRYAKLSTKILESCRPLLDPYR